MDILIDFDNVLPQMKREGLQLLCTRVVNAIAIRKMHFPQKCRIRLYGGWYERSNLTHRAQDLISDIEQHFPDTISWVAPRASGTCIAQLEMAQSLEVEPKRVLHYTHRRRPFSDPVEHDRVALDRCNKTPCPLNAVAEFFKQKKCPDVGCRTTPGDLLFRQEQKLIDAMITADLIHLAKCGQYDLAVVSSDDDLWPGIQTALIYGARVIQVHTHAGRETPQNYTSGLAQYKYTNL